MNRLCSYCGVICSICFRIVQGGTMGCFAKSASWASWLRGFDVGEL